MSTKWQEYSDKFLTVTPREQYLILATGLVVICFTFFNFVIDGKLIEIESLEKKITQDKASINSLTTTVSILEQSLNSDPNVEINKQIAQYENKMQQVDSELLLLTSDLITPIQMRHALVDLLKADKSVSLLAFDAITAESLNLAKDDEAESPEETLSLYKHGLRLKLKGNYFSLRDYLQKIEALEWKFFWQNFDYQLVEYPNSELVIEMYSLSTKKEFIGV